MKAILAIPLGVRLAGFFVLGALLGAAVNWFADRLRYEPSLVGPWHPPRRGVDRQRAHYMPIWGWIARRNEGAELGARFWLRPFCVEVLCALGLPALYWHYTVAAGIVPQFAGVVQASPEIRHGIFVSHTILISLMLIASLVDLDERIIPDTVTIPGTLIGLTFAACWPQTLLPDVIASANGIALRPLTLVSPAHWPSELAGRPNWISVAIGLCCLWVWCIGLMPRSLRARRGWRMALALFWRRLCGDKVSRYLLLMGIVCSAAIVAVWSTAACRWQTLLTALVGMALTGGITWTVRFVASASIGREALGFGDVTLMAMIGAFLGWQAGLMVFFLAPFFGLLLGVAQWVIHRDPEIPYGPFLCLAALAVVLGWPSAWSEARSVFSLGWLIPAVLVAGILLMGVLLRVWHAMIRR